MNHSFVSSFVAASGTGVYGVFELESEGDVIFQEELSSLIKFVDDAGNNLIENPGEQEINNFLDANKKLSVKLPKDQPKAIFTLRGYSTPAKGAKSLYAKARVTFLLLSKEQTKTVKTSFFGTSDKVDVGPVAFRVAKNSGQIVFPNGRTRWSGDSKNGWALLMDARQIPVKQIEVPDGNDMVIG